MHFIYKIVFLVMLSILCCSGTLDDYGPVESVDRMIIGTYNYKCPLGFKRITKMDDNICSPCEEEVIEKTPPCPLQCMSPRCKAFRKTPQVDSSKTPIVWMLGSQSVMSGQSDKITSKFGLTHLLTGSLLRDEINTGSDRTKCLITAMERHDSVANDVVVELLQKAMLAKGGSTKGFLLSKFPRDKRQGIFFEKKIAPVDIIIYFETPKKMVDSAPVDAIDKPVKFSSDIYKEIVDNWPSKMNRINTEGAADAIFNQVVSLLEPIFH